MLGGISCAIKLPFLFPAEDTRNRDIFAWRSHNVHLYPVHADRNFLRHQATFPLSEEEAGMKGQVGKHLRHLRMEMSQSLSPSLTCWREHLRHQGTPPLQCNYKFPVYAKLKLANFAPGSLIVREYIGLY
jgi:hypothetical protein